MAFTEKTFGTSTYVECTKRGCERGFQPGKTIDDAEAYCDKYCVRPVVITTLEQRPIQGGIVDPSGDTPTIETDVQRTVNVPPGEAAPAESLEESQGLNIDQPAEL